MSSVSDITPGYRPIVLARDAVKKIEDSGDEVEGIAVVLLLRGGIISYEMAGLQNTDLLWGLSRLQYRLMTEADD